ncbi:PhoH family protein [Fusobacterium nucleatum]
MRGKIMIETIKQKILQLDAGSFQNLCDSYLAKIGYQDIVSLGGKAGTRKTTLGTPDTYFSTPDGKYIFVEYTTQTGDLFKKIKKDLAKCLDESKTNISHNDILEIIYCHTSPNLRPSQDKELKNICQNVGIKLILIGIDKLAEDIYLFHHLLARDFLGISIDTGQILNIDDFIEEYNSNKLAAPIDTDFLFREKEIEDINKAFKENNIVILNGVAGTGKTRLALHYAKNYIDSHNAKLYCISNKALEIYEDLKLFLNTPGEYILVVDDANQLSARLGHIINYANMQSKDFNIKILITVRSYALQQVLKNIQTRASYSVIDINLFTDDEIKKLLKTSLNILNQNYQEKIIEIAEGNARIAILAGKLACQSQNLNSINDASQLYDDYFGVYLNNEIGCNEDLAICAGIVAFLEAFHLDYIDNNILTILKEKGINKEQFIENIKKLHEREIVDIYNNKAVKFSEQCLSNYFLKYIFFNKKLLSLSSIINIGFQNYGEKIISTVNMLVSIFANKKLIDFVSNEIKIVWRKLKDENSPHFFDFVKHFFRVNPTETLIILKKKIEKSNQKIDNDVIELLGGFSGMADFPTSLELFFQYYLKYPNLYKNFYYIIDQYFRIDRKSLENDFYTQINFLKKLEEFSDKWEEKDITLLFLEIVENFLKFFFNSPENGRKITEVVFYSFSLPISKGVEEYRGLIWESLLKISKKVEYKEKIWNIIYSYGKDRIEKDSLPILEFDLEYIKKLLNFNFPPNNLKNCILANNLLNIFYKIGYTKESLFTEYFNSDSFHLYSLLKGVDYRRERDFEKMENIKKQSIGKYLVNASYEKQKYLIDLCCEYENINKQIEWEITDALRIIFDILPDEAYTNIVKYYIDKNTPLNLNPYNLVKKLFTLISKNEVFNLINNSNFKYKNSWLYTYFAELPQEFIEKEDLQNMYNFLEDTSDKNIVSSYYRDTNFLEKYQNIDKNVFIKGCKIILSKKTYSLSIVETYFHSLFISPKKIIQKFKNNLNLLEEIYFTMFSYEDIFDYNGNFLKELYLVKPSILDKIINFFISKDITFTSDKEKIYQCFFELDNFLNIYNKITEKIITKTETSFLYLRHFLEFMLLSTQDNNLIVKKQDEFIKYWIVNFSKNKLKINCLFSIVAKLDNNRKKEYIKLFIANNELFEYFKKIPLIPTSYGYTGRLIPLYNSWIEYLKSLLPIFVGLKWIEHKGHIEKQIDYLREKIKSEETKEFLGIF